MTRKEAKELFRKEATHLTPRQQDEAMAIMDNFLREAIREYIQCKQPQS
jgi:hypothetical protein